MNVWTSQHFLIGTIVRMVDDVGRLNTHIISFNNPSSIHWRSNIVL